MNLLSKKNLVVTFFKRHWLLILYLVLTLGIRFYNYHEAMYFIYDVGRDAVVLRELAHGDIKLIGATTGLPGVFLGPLWYYIGVVGFFLGSGNPYVIQLWYILVASISIPLFWVLCHQLFGKTIWAPVAAFLLAIIPGSINGTNFVWNPMLSLPLMTGAVICLMKARESKRHLLSGLFLLALTLQSEFAYAIFFVTSGWVLIPWFRGKFDWKTMALAASIVGLTLIPQMLFELTHNFSMTRSLLSSMNQVGTTVPLSYLLEHRPLQLWNASRQFFDRSESLITPLLVGISILIVLGMGYVIIRGTYKERLILVMGILPYIFYMFWKGNYGFFFDYYITPHFIFLTLLLVIGMQTFVKMFYFRWLQGIAVIPVGVVIGWLIFASYKHLDAVILHPINNAGIRAMEQSIQQLYDWSFTDKVTTAVFRIYTPNLHTENYDYLSWWLAKSKGYKEPYTIQQESDPVRYILYEPENHVYNDRFLPWYKDATKNMKLNRTKKIGVLTAETWVRL